MTSGKEVFEDVKGMKLKSYRITTTRWMSLPCGQAVHYKETMMQEVLFSCSQLPGRSFPRSFPNHHPPPILPDHHPPPP